MEFWKKAALKIRVLEREATAESNKSAEVNEREDLIRKLRRRNDLRKSLKDVIAAMQETRSLVEKGLSLRHSFEGADEKDSETLTQAYACELREMKSLLQPLVSTVSELLHGKLNDEESSYEKGEEMVINLQLSLLLLAITHRN